MASDAPPLQAGAAGSRLILVGRVAGGFGVRGELRLTSYTADPAALLRYGPLLDAEGAVRLTLKGGRAVKGGVVARAAEVATKEAADALRGLRLHVPREALPASGDEDEFYHADLIGLVCETPSGERLGRVKAVHDFGAGDILEIGPDGGGASRYLPFTKAAAPAVDLARGRILVVPPPETEAETESGEA